MSKLKTIFLSELFVLIMPFILVCLSLFYPKIAHAISGDVVWVTDVSPTPVEATAQANFNFVEEGVDITMAYDFSNPPPPKDNAALGNPSDPAGDPWMRVSTGTFGNHTGYWRFEMEDVDIDGSEWMELTINFNPPVAGLNFSILDVDTDPTLPPDNWRDSVVISASNDGATVSPTYSTGSAVTGPTAGDNCSLYPGMDCFLLRLKQLLPQQSAILTLILIMHRL